MVGIYKITNLINGKIYIGQSNNIERRLKEHRYKTENSDIPVDRAIGKYGEKNFTFAVLEETTTEQLDARETYWIKYYNSCDNGYNCSLGGDNQSVGSANGRAILTEEDVKAIRIAYKNHLRRKTVYNNYKDKIAFGTFASVWDGSQWSHIMPEVFTKENKEYYSKQATNGELSDKALFTNVEVMALRERYVHETAKQIYLGLETRCTFQTLQHILSGLSYKHLPIYKKLKKEWIK